MIAASRVLVALAARSLAHLDQDVSLPQYRMLVIVAVSGPRPLGDLARDLDVHPSTAGRMVDRLVAKGLLARDQGADRRQVLVRLTDAGQVLVDTVTEARRDEFARWVEGFTEQQVRTLESALALLETKTRQREQAQR